MTLHEIRVLYRARVQVILKMYTTYVTMHDISGRVSLADTGKPEIRLSRIAPNKVKNVP